MLVKNLAGDADREGKTESDLEGSNAMAATTARLALRGLDPAVPSCAVRADRRRHITPEAGHALEILGHAIEYLTDEYVREARQVSAHDPGVRAIQMLMAVNRQIYYACPVKSTFTARLRAFIHPASH